MRLAVLLFALAAGKTDPSLVGTWLLAGQPFFTLNANGTGVMEDGKVKWSVEGATLLVGDDEGGVDRAQYQLTGDTLVITMGGVPLQLTRAGKGVAAQKQGKLAKAMAKQAEGDDAEAMAIAQAQPGGRAGAAQARGAPQPQQGAVQPGPGNDQLSRLIMSSAWCWMKYASGNTYQERYVFAANGTWRSSSESEIYSNNQYAGTTAQAVGNSGSGGQWAVKGGQLYMSDQETPQLVPVPMQLTQNSNGAPIFVVNGREYYRCN
jgi:hypothetical protein